MASGKMDIAEAVVLIVGYNNPNDIANCLAALARAAAVPRFDVYICENGGRAAYERLVRRLIEENLCRACAEAGDARGEAPPSPFLAVQRLELGSRPATVTVGWAEANLGYAGGVNAWLRPLMGREGWKGVWILNPDAEPAPDALGALVARAEDGGKGMVGSTILEAGSEEVVRFRGGLQWRKLSARSVAIGLGERLGAPIDLPAIERAMDSPSGASMYVTRRCVEQIGMMDESYFLFFEDLDWGVRAKKLGLGYASTSVVAHRRGTTTGSAGRGAALSRLAVYLQHRNAIHFVRRHYPWTLPLRIAMSIAYAVRFALNRAPGAGAAALEGMSAGIRGETGAPSWHRNPS
ncbi:glycosyltransferase family 2 protein [Rhodoblastus acidophilus]|uniref:Glycosyltransferase family 2 protein n=1 Tax=Candidatus Rhodoblastus alkanivorans TaxID=2954117 RepID=A0ABS9ZAE6_9HYPH|nr:glycosyltransferase family 2 protein [Candidatus Rhodoblastus alkanivorans]MCI4677043.1 glycosyltransferase family 2 protein [Candidatus Rhodoblastus alkanivorans]MCI4684396.1 glycosyltransferase family 2 protein [Candidatus Rhodoblastus alkanivorans]MDI4641717.1 glycosyltransferase family 2 protein [Rhodoblastus acidophilus]